MKGLIMIAVMLAEGFEELEALTPVDILRRAGLDVKTVAIGNRTTKGTHGISVIADLVADELALEEVDAVIFPGGMPGATNLDACPFTDKIIEAVTSRGGRLAAICAAPLVLGRRGLLRSKKATCFPGFEGELVGAIATGEPVVTDGCITTGRDMWSAMAFAEELRSLFGDK